MMSKKRVAIINAREVSSFFLMAWESPAIATIVACLEKEGIDDIVLFPSTQDEADIKDYELKVAAFLKKFKPDIIAVSTWTSGYRMACDMAYIARKVCPTAMVTAGGPHFSSAEEIRNALLSNEFDIVFRGGASPFGYFCKNYFNGKISTEKVDGKVRLSGDIPSSGVCYRDERGDIKINRRGVLEIPVVPVAEIHDDHAAIRVIVNDVCPNGCDYCIIEPSVMKKGNLDPLISQCAALYANIQENTGMRVRFSIDDSAPFYKRERLRETLHRFKGISQDVSFSLFADPQDIGPDMFEIIKEYNVSSLFFGRDRVVQDGLLGRKYLGKLRSRGMLDWEKERIKSLMEFASSNCREKGLDIYLGYILSPFETAETSKRMTEEIKFFSCFDTGSPNIRVQTDQFILNPYPGTKVAERFAGKFIPMREFYHPYPNVWLGDEVRHFQLETTRFIISKLLCCHNAREICPPIMDFVHKYQYEGTLDVSLSDNIACADMRNLARFIMDFIGEMNFKYEPNSPSYAENILNMHLLGCMAVAVLRRPEWLRQGLFLKTMKAVKEFDGIYPLLLKDLKTISRYPQVKND